MTRVLRAAWSRRGTLLALAATTLVVVAGAVVVTRLADAAGTSPWLGLPVYLLGAVAVAGTGRELAARRREETGLHRLRGIRGTRLVVALLAEPVLAVGAGLLAGLAAGSGATVLLARWWLGEGTSPLDGPSVGVAVLVALGGLAVVAAGLAAALREPLSAQVAVAARPRRAGTTTVFLSVLVVVGAVVACYRAAAGDAGDPDAVVLLGPALVALSAGLLTARVLRLAADRLAGRTAGSGIAAFLAVRRLGRSADAVAPVRLLVAAGVLGSLTLTGAVAVADWADDSARLATGGPRLVPVEGGALEALALSRDLDPEGRHLMAVAAVTDPQRAADRRAFVDAARYRSVVGDHLDGTAAGAAVAVAALATGEGPHLVTGDVLEVAVADLRRSGPARRVRVTVDYLADGSATGSTEAETTLRPGGRGRAGVPVDDCRRACVVRGLRVESLLRVAGGWQAVPDPDLSVLVTRLRLGDADLLAQPYVPEPDLPVSRYEQVVLNRPDGLRLAGLREGSPAVVVEAGSGALPVLVTRGADAEDTVGTPGGAERAVDVRGTAVALPFVAAGGVLADLPGALVGDAPTVPAADVGVVVGAGAPQRLVDALVDATGARPRTVDSARQAAYDVPGAHQADVYLVTAVACLLVALVALAGSVGGQRAEHRAQVAALRVVGVPTTTARRAGRLELGLLATLTAVGVLAGGWVAVRLLLTHLRLVSVPVHGLPVDTSVQWAPLAGSALLAAAAVLGLGARARDVPDRLTRPATLRTGSGTSTGSVHR